MVPINDFAYKIRKAKSATSPNGVVLIARIESFICGEGLSDALNRGLAYEEAGADAILIHSKSKTPDEVLSFCRFWKQQGGTKPVIVVPTTYYSVTVEELAAAGVSMVIYANHGLRASIGAIDSAFGEICSSRNTVSLEKKITPVPEVLSFIGMQKLRRDQSEQRNLPATAHGRRYILLNPGPVVVHQEVREALAGPDLCHREEEFYNLLCSTREKVVSVCEGSADHGAVVLTGSGTAALESVLVSSISGKLLVLDNGNYGERILKIVTTHGVEFQRLEFGWGNPFDLDRIRDVLSKDSSITAIAMVHHETSTGMLNPLRKIGLLAQEFGVELIVDAISSVGGEPFSMVEDHVDWCVGSSNKCIEGTPGLSFVCAKREKFEKLKTKPRRAFYLDLYAHYQSQYFDKAPLFTPSVQTFYAFEAALRHLLQEGTSGRHARYQQLATQMREGLKQRGFQFVLPPEQMSCVCTIVSLPSDVQYSQLHDGLKERGFIIYSTQFRRGEVFRIATIGQLTAADIEVFLFTLDDFLSSFERRRVANE